MNELAQFKDPPPLKLSEEDKKNILKHLRKGGHPTSVSAVTGISSNRLMYYFNHDPEFAMDCQQVRAQALAALEYALHEMATNGPPREAIKAIELSLGASIPEIYATHSSKAEDKIKKIINKG